MAGLSMSLREGFICLLYLSGLPENRFEQMIYNCSHMEETKYQIGSYVECIYVQYVAIP